LKSIEISEQFPHFHDVYEVVIFGDVDSQFAAEGRRYDLRLRSIAYVPSMRHTICTGTRSA